MFKWHDCLGRSTGRAVSGHTYADDIVSEVTYTVSSLTLNRTLLNPTLTTSLLDTPAELFSKLQMD